MATRGPNFPNTAANDTTVGTVVWVNATNVTTDDGSNATCTGTADTTKVGNYVKATGFGFSIPEGSKILGILVEWKVSNSIGTCTDSSAKLVKGNTILGNENKIVTAWGASAYLSHGSASDLWGLTWVASDINASTFGAVLAPNMVGACNAACDAVRITVTYTPPSDQRPGQVF